MADIIKMKSTWIHPNLVVWNSDIELIEGVKPDHVFDETSLRLTNIGTDPITNQVHPDIEWEHINTSTSDKITGLTLPDDFQNSASTYDDITSTWGFDSVLKGALEQMRGA